MRASSLSFARLALMGLSLVAQAGTLGATLARFLYGLPFAALWVAVLHALRRLGVRIAIDDYGTGYSSLAYLNRFPFDALKVDRSFVDGLGVEQERTAIVEAVIGMARALSLDAIAEGVENEAQLSELRRLGCDFAQGHLFSRPLAPEKVTALLKEGGFELLGDLARLDAGA